MQTLHRNSPTKILSIRPTQRQPIAQTRNRAAPITSRRDNVQGITITVAAKDTAAVAAITTARNIVVRLAKGGEGVAPDVREDVGADAAAAVADADGHAGGVIVQRSNSIATEYAAVLLWRGEMDGGLLILVLVAGWLDIGRLRGDGDDDGLAVHAVLDRRTEGILEKLCDDVLEVHGNEGEGGVGFPVDNPLRADAVVELADVGDEFTARVDGGGGTQGGINHPNVARVFGARGRARGRIEVRRATKVQGDVLLGDEARADAGAQMLIQEAGHLGGRYVFTTL